MRQYEKGRREGFDVIATRRAGREGSRTQRGHRVELALRPHPTGRQAGREDVTAMCARVLAMVLINMLMNPMCVGVRDPSEVAQSLSLTRFRHVRD